MKSLKDKVVAITGAGSGLGRDIARLLAKEGARLSLSDINREGLRETAEICRRNGARDVTETLVDVTRRAEMFAWADATHGHFGRVDIAINNAGVALGCTAEALDPKDLQWVMEINFWGVVHGSQAFLPHLRASGDGCLINMSSLYGLVTMPGQAAYSASKFAVRGFSDALSLEMALSAAPVRVILVHPGGIKTNIAKAAVVRESLQQLMGMSGDETLQAFDKQLITSSETAARKTVDAIRHGQRRVLIGPDALGLDALWRLSPWLYRTIITSLFSSKIAQRKNS